MALPELRPLLLAEVEISIDLEPEHIDPHGNLCATDDPEQDRLDVEAVNDRLRRGDESAWCVLVVRASWESDDGQKFVGRDVLGGVSLEGGSGPQVARQAKELADWHGMPDEALDDLNRGIAEHVQKARATAQQLSTQAEFPALSPRWLEADPSDGSK